MSSLDQRLHAEHVELLKSSEVAQILRVPVSTLYVWRMKGTGPIAYRVGKRTLYRRADVTAWLEGRRSDPGA